MLDTLLVPGEFGPGELEPVARSLGGLGVCTQVGPVPELPHGLMSLATEQLRTLDGGGGGSELGERFAVAVSFGAGAAAAVHAVTSHKADAAILVDPPAVAIISHWPAAFAEVPVDHQLGLQIVEPLEAFDDAQLAAGDWTPGFVDAITGAFTGDPTRLAQAESAKAYWLSPRVSLVRRGFGEADADSADWVRPLFGMEGSPVQLWFSEPQHALASYLEDHTQLRVLRQPWPDRAWLAEPDTVTNAVLQQLSRS